MVKYAQIDDTGKVVGISHLSGKVDSPLMIEVGEDFNSFEKRYVDGRWEDIEPDEPTEPEPTESEMIQSEILLNQTKIIAEQESQSAILAELILSQAEREVN